MPRMDWDDDITPSKITLHFRLYVPPEWRIDPAAPLISIDHISEESSNTSWKEVVNKILKKVNESWAKCCFGKHAPLLTSEDVDIQFQRNTGRQSIVAFLDTPGKPKPCTSGSLGYFWEYHEFNNPPKAFGLQKPQTLKSQSIDLAIYLRYRDYLDRTQSEDRTPSSKRPRKSATTYEPPKKKPKKRERALSTPEPLPDTPPPTAPLELEDDDDELDQLASDDNNMGLDDLPPPYPPAQKKKQVKPTPSGSGTSRTPAAERERRVSPVREWNFDNPPPPEQHGVSPFSAAPRQTPLPSPSSPKKRVKAKPSVSNSSAKNTQTQDERPRASTSAVPPSSQTLPGSPAISPVKTTQASQPAGSTSAKPASASKASEQKKQKSPQLIDDSDDDLPSLEPASPYIAPSATSRSQSRAPASTLSQSRFQAPASTAGQSQASKKPSSVSKGKRKAQEPVSNSTAPKEKSRKINPVSPAKTGFAIAKNGRVAGVKKAADLSYEVGDILRYTTWASLVAHGVVWKNGVRSKPGHVEVSDFEKQPADYETPFPTTIIKTEDPVASGSQRGGFGSGKRASQQPVGSTSTQRPENVPLPSSDDSSDLDLPDISQPNFSFAKPEKTSPVKAAASASGSPSKYSRVKKEKMSPSKSTGKSSMSQTSPAKGKTTFVDLTLDSD